MMLRLLKLLLLFSFFIVSCRSKNEADRQMLKGCDRLQRVDNLYTTIDLEHAEERAYDDFIDSIHYIPLGDECGVIGNILNIITYKGRFYIQEDHFDRVFIYDESGKCLKKIDNKGRGPSEYLRVESIDINTEKEELILVDGMSDKLFFYDLDGNFKYLRRLGRIQASNSLWLHDSTFLHLMSPGQNVGSEELHGYALLLSKGGQPFYRGYRYIPFQDGCRGGGVILKGCNSVYYYPVYSDTIYQIATDSTYIPKYNFKIKNSSWEKYQVSDRFILLDGDETGVFPRIFETHDFLIAYIADKKIGENRLQPLLYDRILGRTYLLRWSEYQSLSEMDCFGGYMAWGVCGDWFIALGTYSNFESNDIFERVRDGSLKMTNPELEKIIRNMDTDSNPVLILTRFKHL